MVCEQIFRAADHLRERPDFVLRPHPVHTLCVCSVKFSVHLVPGSYMLLQATELCTQGLSSRNILVNSWTLWKALRKEIEFGWSLFGFASEP